MIPAQFRNWQCRKNSKLVYWFMNLAIQSCYCLHYTRNLNNLIFNKLKLNNQTLHKQVPQIKNLTSLLGFYNSPAILLPDIHFHSSSHSVHFMMTMKNNDNDHINFASYRRFGPVNIGQKEGDIHTYSFPQFRIATLLKEMEYVRV
jgi:hypothetical protein